MIPVDQTKDTVEEFEMTRGLFSSYELHNPNRSEPRLAPSVETYAGSKYMAPAVAPEVLDIQNRPVSAR